MMIAAKFELSEDHMVAMVGSIIDRAERSGIDRAFILTELRAFVANPSDFLDVKVELSFIPSVEVSRIHAAPNARLEHLLERFGGVK